MLQVFAQAGMPRRVPPAPARCGNGGFITSDDGPQIVSPLRGAAYVLRVKSAPALTLRANAGRAGLVYWFEDLVWVPPGAGRYLLSAGRCARRGRYA